jgi:hypothetical protein
MKQKEKQVFWKDSSSMSLIESNVEKVKPIIQGIVDEFKTLNVEIISIDEIIELLNSHRVLNTEKLTDKLIKTLYSETIKGHWFDMESFKKVATIPDTTALIQAFEPLSAFQNSPGFRDQVYWPVYVLNAGTVEVNPEMLAKVSAMCVEITETPEEIERLEAINDLCTQLNRFSSLAAPGQNIDINSLVQFNDQTRKFEPGRTYVKTGAMSETMLFASRPYSDLKSKPLSGSVASGPDDDESQQAANIAKARNAK